MIYYRAPYTFSWQLPTYHVHLVFQWLCLQHCQFGNYCLIYYDKFATSWQVTDVLETFGIFFVFVSIFLKCSILVQITDRQVPNMPPSSSLFFFFLFITVGSLQYRCGNISLRLSCILTGPGLVSNGVICDRYQLLPVTYLRLALIYTTTIL